jgi:hypothetical protein
MVIGKILAQVGRRVVRQGLALKAVAGARAMVPSWQLRQSRETPWGCPGFAWIVEES